MARRRRRLGTLAATIVALAVLAGCTERQGPPPQLVITTTTEPGATTTTLPGGPPPLPPRTLGQVTRELDAAVSARDFCKLVVALDDAAPDASDGRTVIAAYEALAAAAHRARGFVPDELASIWPVVVSAIDEGVQAARRVGGDVQDPALRAPFLDGSFESAMSAVETWADAHCGTS
jgi:hypothetical protein